MKVLDWMIGCNYCTNLGSAGQGKDGFTEALSSLAKHVKETGHELWMKVKWINKCNSCNSTLPFLIKKDRDGNFGSLSPHKQDVPGFEYDYDRDCYKRKY